jgi:MinD superfamily P-loop ATPase
MGGWSMRIAVASGKGGTGKSTLATNLAFIGAQNGRTIAYVDCDVEEPNGHIFLRPEICYERPIGKKIPVVDISKCIFCDRCEKICQFNAIACFAKEILIYPELCHACGGCQLVCPTAAISEKFLETGKLEVGRADGMRFVQGVLNVGEPLSPPLVSAVKSAVPKSDLEIIDAPPGTSCPVIESIRGSDYVLLVTEPTPFGLHDLKLAIEMVKALKLPFGVVINRIGIGNDDVMAYCQEERIQVLAKIPDDRRIAEEYSNGHLFCEFLPEYRPLFESLLAQLSLQDPTESAGHVKPQVTWACD